MEAPCGTRRGWVRILVLCLLLPISAATSQVPKVELAAAPEPVAPAGARLEHRRVVHEGIAVDFAIEPVLPRPDAAVLREEEDVSVRFTITDTTTGTPLTGVYPSAWMDLRAAEGPGTDPRMCVKKAETLSSGSLFSRAEADLNVYYVLALNDDPTITVVDPLFGFGGTKLIAFIDLPSPGADWVLSADQTRLFVSLPATNQVAVIDTATWRLLTTLEAGPRPTRLVLQPDGHYLWVANDATDLQAAGVTVLTTLHPTRVAHLPTGRGPHDIVVSDDNRFAFVMNAGAGLDIDYRRGHLAPPERGTHRPPTHLHCLVDPRPECLRRTRRGWQHRRGGWQAARDRGTYAGRTRSGPDESWRLEGALASWSIPLQTSSTLWIRRVTGLYRPPMSNTHRTSWPFPIRCSMCSIATAQPC